MCNTLVCTHGKNITKREAVEKVVRGVSQAAHTCKKEGTKHFSLLLNQKSGNINDISISSYFNLQ